MATRCTPIRDYGPTTRWGGADRAAGLRGDDGLRPVARGARTTSRRETKWRVAGRAAVPLGQRLTVLPAGGAGRCARSHAGGRGGRGQAVGVRRAQVIVTNKLTWANQRGEVGQRPAQVVRARRAAQRERPLGRSSAESPQGSTGVVHRRAVGRDRGGVRRRVSARRPTRCGSRMSRSAQSLPTMVKGPLTVTDLINMHMGGGWFGYGNPPLRLGFENRKKMRGLLHEERIRRVGCRAARALGARVGPQGRRACGV